ncbi:hypothetical protein PROAA_930013 [Candidatus Propionivibrio aalborgensis]|uniref:Uncharacterized protein n=1 Tax=Candidatus Propionivibrio aalborgensis TaxID=1860101 RepID=A0A1A8Y2J3_9RHOO|nr:hypothetical protein PROAA_930013 [Candidatus Propionivibrio aalborgensis]
MGQTTEELFNTSCISQGIRRMIYPRPSPSIFTRNSSIRLIRLAQVLALRSVRMHPDLNSSRRTEESDATR